MGSSVACGKCDRETCQGARHKSCAERCVGNAVVEAPPLPPVGVLPLSRLKERYERLKQLDVAFDKIRGRKLFFVRHRQFDVDYVCRALHKDGIALFGAVTQAKYLAKLGSVDHPHLCRFIEAFEDNEFLYLIYEKATPKTLFDYIQTAKRFTEGDAADCLRQMASALAVAHKNDIFHGSLGPQDVVLKDDTVTESPQVKICDLGIAFVLQPSPMQMAFPETKVISNVEAHEKLKWDKEAQATQARICGCLPPEVVAGAVQNDLTRIPGMARKLDIWGLGCLVYLMLCGRLPFSPGVGQDPKGLLLDIKKGDVQFFWSDWANYPVEARDCVTSMLNVKAQQRPEALALLQHRWLLLRQEKVSRATVVQLLTDVRQNALSGLVARLTLRLSSQWHATRKQKTEVERMFRFLDAKSDGVLDVEELAEAYEKYVPEMLEDVEAILYRMDRDGSGFANLDEFQILAANQKEMFQRHNLESVFRAVDARQTGAILLEDIEKAALEIDAHTIGPGHALNAIKGRIMAERTENEAQRTVLFDEFVDLVHMRPYDPKFVLTSASFVKAQLKASLGMAPNEEVLRDLLSQHWHHAAPLDDVYASRQKKGCRRHLSCVENEPINLGEGNEVNASMNEVVENTHEQVQNVALVGSSGLECGYAANFVHRNPYAPHSHGPAQKTGSPRSPAKRDSPSGQRGPTKSSAVQSRVRQRLAKAKQLAAAKRTQEA